MTWLVAGLPLAVLAASAITIGVAGGSPVASSDGETRRIAQIQIEDLAPDREAARRGLRARMDGDPLRGRIEVRLDDAGLDTATLDLSMLHPLDERLDRRLALQRDGDVWRATTAPWSGHAWGLRLSSRGSGWRLSGRLAGDATRATLMPAVER